MATSERRYIKPDPKRPGLKVSVDLRLRKAGQKHIPDEGMWVLAGDPYYNRRLRDGDVVEAEPPPEPVPAPAKASAPAVKDKE